MKEKWIKSAVPIYGCAAIWLLMGLICPGFLLKIGGILLAAVLSFCTYSVLNRIFKPRSVEVRKAPRSGDKGVDALILEALSRLDQLQLANEAIENAEISCKLNRMVKAGNEIMNALEQNPTQINDVRRFMNYYLPTADKLMQNYRMMLTSDNAGENIRQAMGSVENSLGMIADAFEKQLDKLYSDQKLDIETDIEVLETMMASDGLIGYSTDINEKNITAQAGK